MRIRTQLVAAFLLLAVVPLTIIVLFSYFTSIRAVERAVEAEASERTAEMDQRLKGIRRKLQHGMAGLSQFPFGALLRHPDELPPSDRELMDRVMAEIGDAAPFMNGLMVVPKPPPPPIPKESEISETSPAPEAPEAPPAPISFADLETRPFRIDFVRLKESLRELRESQEVGARQESEEAMAELRRESAEMAIVALSKTLEAIGGSGDEEGLRKIEQRLERELEQQQERIARQIERATRLAAVTAIRVEERRAAEEERRHAERLLGQDLGIEIQEQGEVVAEVRAEVKPDLLLHQVLGAPRDEGELRFVIDREGQLLAKANDRRVLESLELERDPQTRRAVTRRRQDDWMIVSTADPDYEVTLGVAYPIGASLAEIQRTTARNLAIGLGLVGLALLGVLPLAKHITEGLETVTEGAKRIAHGDLSTRVEVASRSEVGLLAAAFNRMAEDLKAHQARLIEEEGRRKEQELEFQRKSRELEDARQFQLSLLPKSVPRHPSLEVAVDMKTAAEVGGDYYDFHLEDDGTLTFAIGDATGHGARAGTMVTVVKSLFSSTAAGQPLNEFLQRAAGTIKKMDLGRMAMALTVARFDGDRLTLSAAGMPPALVYRAGSGEVEELDLPGMPLGGLASTYQEHETKLGTGDTLLLLSDGLPELPDGNGEPLGYPAVREAFATAAPRSPDEVIEELTATAARWAGGGPPSDDMTFLVVKRTPQPLSK